MIERLATDEQFFFLREEAGPTLPVTETVSAAL
jgi:hypothetical protein